MLNATAWDCVMQRGNTRLSALRKVGHKEFMDGSRDYTDACVARKHGNPLAL
jgi:hypothetical protein